MLDLAIKDAEWLRPRLHDVEAGKPTDAVQWMKDALKQIDIQIAIQFTDSPSDAKKLEVEMIKNTMSRLCLRAVVRKRNRRTAS